MTMSFILGYSLLIELEVHCLLTKITTKAISVMMEVLCYRKLCAFESASDSEVPEMFVKGCIEKVTSTDKIYLLFIQV